MATTGLYECFRDSVRAGEEWSLNGSSQRLRTTAMNSSIRRRTLPPLGYYIDIKCRTTPISLVGISQDSYVVATVENYNKLALRNLLRSEESHLRIQKVISENYTEVCDTGQRVVVNVDNHTLTIMMAVEIFTAKVSNNGTDTHQIFARGQCHVPRSTASSTGRSRQMCQMAAT